MCATAACWKGRIYISGRMEVFILLLLRFLHWKRRFRSKNDRILFLFDPPLLSRSQFSYQANPTTPRHRASPPVPARHLFEFFPSSLTSPFFIQSSIGTLVLQSIIIYPIPATSHPNRDNMAKVTIHCVRRKYFPSTSPDLPNPPQTTTSLADNIEPS